MIKLIMEGCCESCPYIELNLERIWADKNHYNIRCVHSCVCGNLKEEKEKEENSRGKHCQECSHFYPLKMNHRYGICYMDKERQEGELKWHNGELMACSEFDPKDPANTIDDYLTLTKIKESED